DEDQRGRLVAVDLVVDRDAVGRPCNVLHPAILPFASRRVRSTVHACPISCSGAGTTPRSSARRYEPERASRVGRVARAGAGRRGTDHLWRLPGSPAAPPPAGPGAA